MDAQRDPTMGGTAYPGRAAGGKASAAAQERNEAGQFAGGGSTQPTKQPEVGGSEGFALGGKRSSEAQGRGGGGQPKEEEGKSS